MKKNTLLLLAFLTLFSANIFAQTAYDLYVADMQVTSENKDDIAAAINALNDPERTASGTITYDPITDTLTLENATINANGYVNNGIRYIYEHSAWLTIKLVGENTINAADDGIVTSIFTEITGSGSLTINAKYGISISDGSLKITNTTVTVNGSGSGITGNPMNNYYDYLTIKNSTVSVTGANASIVFIDGGFNLDYCAITQPVGAVFENGAIKLNGEIVKTEILIEPIICYDLWFGEVTPSAKQVHINELNKDNITAAINALNMETKTASGIINYNSENKILTLNNASYEAPDSATIFSKIDGLTINLIGENIILAPGYNSQMFSNYAKGIALRKNATITGNGGSLGIVSQTTGISASENLTIDNIGLTVTPKSFLLGGGVGIDVLDTLTINNSTVVVPTGGIKAGKLNLNCCEITQPVGAYLDEEQKWVVDSEGTPIKTQEIRIEPLFMPAVTIATLTNGTVVATPNKDVAVGTIVALTVTPAEGYQLVANSLRAYKTGDESVAVVITNDQFAMPAYDVTVTAEFELKTAINENIVNSIAVYPNPNNGEFTINIGEIGNARSYQIIDAKGAIVKEAKINNNEEFVSIKAVAGNYTVRIFADNKTFVETIIVK